MSEFYGKFEHSPIATHLVKIEKCILGEDGTIKSSTEQYYLQNGDVLTCISQDEFTRLQGTYDVDEIVEYIT